MLGVCCDDQVESYPGDADVMYGFSEALQADTAGRRGREIQGEGGEILKTIVDKHLGCSGRCQADRYLLTVELEAYSCQAQPTWT